MPIETAIYYDEKLVHAKCAGIVSREDLYSYQKTVWIDSVTYGFDCVFDMCKADLSTISFADLLPFASKAVMIDTGQPATKLAVVVSEEFQERLSKFYQSALELSPLNKTRSMQIFYETGEAEDWIRNC